MSRIKTPTMRAARAEARRGYVRDQWRTPQEIRVLIRAAEAVGRRESGWRHPNHPHKRVHNEGTMGVDA